MRVNVTKLHYITQSEPLDGSQPVVRKIFGVLVTVSKMFSVAFISRNHNFPRHPW